VKKSIQHCLPDLVEVSTEPDGEFMFMDPTDYATYYYDVAHPVRSVNANVPIGGPATSVPRGDYLDALRAHTQYLGNQNQFHHLPLVLVQLHVDPSMARRIQAYRPSTRPTFRNGTGMVAAPARVKISVRSSVIETLRNRAF
jgi:hypothetical protein